MNRQTTRRMVLAALVAMVAGSAALGIGHSASAWDDVKRVGDYSSVADFKATCDGAGGTFIEDDGLGNTECHYPDGSWTECDANAHDCWHTPSIPAPSGTQLRPTDGTITAVPIGDGTTRHSESGDRQKAKKRGHRGKGRKH